MGSPSIVLEFESGEAEQMLTHLGHQFDQPTPDNIASALTSILSRELRSSLMTNGSVATGQGLSSIMPVHLGTGVYGIEMKSYLEHLDKGSSPHRVPVKNNTRLQEWSQMNGIDPYALAGHIANHGTQPHEFQRPAVRGFNKIAASAGISEMAKMKDEIS